jgi:hypothetical protein
MTKPLAILISDVHLSLEPPVARSNEDDWLEAQARVLRKVKYRALDANVPVICAGDLFHHWKSSPELINFALDELPDKMFCIPGQHDLPHHHLKDISKSAYGVLAKAGKIIDMSNGKLYITSKGLRINPYPWGKLPTEKENRGDPDAVNLAVIHAYCWTIGNGFLGAPTQNHAFNFKLDKFNVALFGDNHHPFTATRRKCQIYNHGCLIRRSIDEKPLSTGMGVLFDDGSISILSLGSLEEKWIATEKAVKLEKTEADITRLAKSFEALGRSSDDFHAALNHYLKQHDIDSRVQQIIKVAANNET